MRYKHILFIILFISLISCRKEKITLTDKTLNFPEIIGTWVLSGYQDSLSIMVRNDSLMQNNYGFIFKKDHTFIERKNAGWCGTPPIFYDNFNGKWTKISNQLLDIQVDFWGGQTNYKIEIISFLKDTLKIHYHYN